MQSYRRWIQEDPGFSANYIYGGVMAAINSALSVFLFYTQDMRVFLSIALGSVLVIGLIVSAKPGKGDWVFEFKKLKLVPREILIGAGVISFCFLIFLTVLSLFSFYSFK